MAECFGHVDVFICAEDDLDPVEQQHVLDLYQPIAVMWDNEMVSPPEGLRVNNFKMFKRIYQCDQLRQRQEEKMGVPYDIVIRTRPDLIFFNAFPIPRSILPRRIYFPMRVKNEPIFYGLPDLFFWGDSSAMKEMCECYLHLHNLEKVFSCLNEYIFMNYMVYRGLIARKVVFRLNLFDRTFWMGRQFVDKYIKSKFTNFVQQGATCYQNNHYDELTIEEEEDDQDHQDYQDHQDD